MTDELAASFRKIDLPEYVVTGRGEFYVGQSSKLFNDKVPKDIEELFHDGGDWKQVNALRATPLS